MKNKIYKIYNSYNNYKSYIRFVALWATNRSRPVRAALTAAWRHYRRHLRRQRRRYFAWVTLASLALQLVLPLAGLIQPVQANNLIKPTQKGDSLFENQSPGFKAEFGDRKDPAAHRLRFEAEPDYNGYNNYNGYKGYSAEKPSAFQRAKEAVLGAESKGVELRLVELGESTQAPVEHSLSSEASSLAPESVVSTGFGRTGDFSNEKSGPSEKLDTIQSQIKEVETELKNVETGIASVSKDVAEVTKVTKNILEESGVGKPELAVRPSMEETPEDFAKSAGYNNYNDYNGYNERSAPPATLTAPIDTISQTIDETTKVEYQVMVGRGVKESLTLLSTPEKQDSNGKTQEGGFNQFTFELKLDPGVEVRQSMDSIIRSDLPTEGRTFTNSTIYFVDKYGRYLFHFQTPYMIDAGGARSSAVKLDLSTQEQQDNNGKTQDNAPAKSSSPSGSSSVLNLVLTADPAWLADPARVYPVLIDPTIVHEDNPAFASGTENRSQTTTTPAVEIQYKELQPDINTVGLWHFNEGSSTTAYDSSGNANNGTLTNGPVWNGPTDTILGKSSLKFDDVNDYVTTADAASLDLTTNGTIEAWVKPNAIEDNNWIVCKASNYCVGLNSTGAVLYTGASAQNDGGTGVTTANQWYHIAVTNNNITATYYVNGVQTGTDAVAWGSTLTNALEFGRDGSTNYFDGTIDEIRISNVVRTPEEIAADASRYPYAVHESPVIDFGSTPNTLDSLNYSATGVQTGDGEKPFSTDGLVAQWNFNETSGTTAYNMAGSDSCGGTPSSCNLTLNNFASTSSQDQAVGTGWTANDKRWGAGSINISSVATADTLSLSNPSTLDPNSADLSIETWVKTTDVTAEIFSNNSANGVSCTSDGYYLGIDASGYPVFTLDTDGATAGCDATITSGITKKVNDGVWHHLAATVTRGSAAYLYMDGALIGSDTSITAYASEAPSGNVLIGSTNNFDGTLDSLRFYARALTSSEVLANFQVGNIEFQTRTGATSTPNDGTWEAWKTTSGTGDTQIASMDADSANWSADNTNPASSGINKSDDSTTKFEGTGSMKLQTGNPTVETSAVALYHLEETSGTGAYIQDSSSTNADGTPTGTTVVDGFYGKGRSFNGSSDYIDIGTGPTSVKSVEFWVNPTTTTEYFVNTTGTGTYIWANAGTVTATGFTSPTIYVDGAVSSTIVAGKWQHVAVTSATAVNASNLDIGRTADANYLEGKIDEVRLLNGVLSADSVAEAYRAGRDHRISKSLTSTDLTSKTKLPFYIASDRPGTFLEATVGESAYANYEPDANTVGLWHLEEAAGSGAYIKDSSGNGNHGTPTGTTFIQGKIGKARSFNGSSDLISCADANCGGTSKLDLSAPFTVEAWVKTSTNSTYMGIVGKTNNGNWSWALAKGTDNKYFTFGSAGTSTAYSNAHTESDWLYVVGIFNGASSKMYVNGVDETNTVTGTNPADTTAPFEIGHLYGAGGDRYWNGSIDEVRISNIVRTADEIRQAYEVGKRTHPITIDFKADLDSSNLITGSSDLSFAINPDINVVNSPLNIAKGEKIIVKENVNGTEYIAQGTVSAVTYANGISNANAPSQNATNANTSTITVTAWDSGGTFPTGGYTTAATVFKWQREYMDLTGSLTTQRDAITRLTMRVTDGSQGANVWLDDFESADYSDGSRVAIGSTAQRYFQYRAILSVIPAQAGIQSGSPIGSGMTSPALTSVLVNYNSGTTPQPPRTKDGSSDFSTTGTTLDRVVDAGSGQSPQLELAYKELPKDINTVGLWHMNENAGTTTADVSGNSYTGTFGASSAAPSWTTSSKLGTSAISFDGGDYIDFSSQVIPLGAKTIEVWIKSSASSASNIYSNEGCSSSNYGSRIFMNTGLIVFTVRGGGTDKFEIASARAVNDGAWHHISASWDGTTNSNGARLYIDGLEDARGTAGSTETTNATNNLRIGACSGATPANYWNGSIDELRISNIARSPEEIKLDAQHRPYGVYTSDVQNLGTNVSSIDNLRWTENGVQTGDGETPYSTNGLVAQWNFNETSGTTAANNAGTGSCGGTPSSCNGTLTNFASTASQDQAAGTGWTKDNRKWGAGAIMIASAAAADTITVSDPASNNLDPNSADLTISMWIKTTDITAELFSNNANNGTACTANGYYLGIDASGYPVFYLDTNGVTAGCDAQISTGITTKINDGQWHFLSVSVTRGTSALLYLDGVQIGSDTSVTSYASITVTGNIQIASNANYDGIIDVINFYSRALAASEILANYQAGNVELQTRTGTTTTPNDGTWEAWKPSGNSTEVQLDNLQTLSPVQKINTSNLVGYWKLDEVSGNRADSAGSNTLTDNATVTSKAGHLNLAGQFTAANSEYLSIADNAAMSTGDIDFSLGAWVYLDSKAANQGIIAKYAASQYEFSLLYRQAIDRFELQIYNLAGSSTLIAADNLGSPSTGTWYYISAWHDATANTINIQVNNGAVNSTAETVTMADGTAAFTIGSRDTAETFNGRIDEVAMWKRVLTAGERKTLYEDGLDKTNDSVVGGINRSIDTTTKIEGSGSEKLTIGAPQVDASTVGLWHMEETSGTGAYIKDATANANHGTPTGTSVVDGFFGKARSFNGTSDYVSVTDADNLSFTNEIFSIEAWVKTTATGTQSIAMKGVASNYEYDLRIQSNVAVLVLWPSSGASDERATGTSTVNNGKWHHIVGTVDGSNIRIYVDGVLETTSAVSVSQQTNGTSALNIGRRADDGGYFNGQMDEVRISNTARSAEEIAEAFRAGRDHRLSKTISSTDLSAKTKLPFYVASDRPGTFLEATVGESALLNNFAGDPDLKGYWPLDENSTGAAAVTRNDYSGNGNNLTDNATVTSTQGKIGKAGQFTAANSEYLSIADNAALSTGNTPFSIAAWAYADSLPAWSAVATKYGSSTEYALYHNAGWRFDVGKAGGGSTGITSTLGAASLQTWYFIVAWYDGTNINISINNGAVDSIALGDTPVDSAGAFNIGRWGDGSGYFNGRIDNVMFLKRVLTADERRQMFEIGKRTHQITNDFVTTPQAAYSSGTSVTINNPYGTTNLTDTLSIGDTMIFKENVGGTETVSQAVVTGITNTSSVYGTVTLLAAPTFPSGGFTTNATVFKWQREFMDVTGILGSPNTLQNPLNSSKDAISRITLRVTDGSAGANIWIDDIKAAGPYLTVGTARTSTIASTPRQYFQYRIIFSTTDTAVSPTVTAISVQYHSAPKKVTGADTFASGTYDNDGNVQLGSNNVKDVQFYDRTKDQISYALDFDDVNDYVTTADAAALDLSTNGTIEAWVKPTNSEANNWIVCKASNYCMGLNATGAVLFTGASAQDDGGTSAATAGQWYHIAVTNNNTTATYYVNGVQTSTDSVAWGSTLTNALEFGRDGSTNYFDGIIDEVAIFSTVRTASQVTADYNARRLSDSTTGLVGLWHFDEGSGTRAYDSSGSNNHGTLTNMTDDDWVNSLSDKDQSALSQQVLGVDPNWGNGPVRESYAMNFDGTGDYISVADNADWNFGSGDVTIDGWVKFASLTAPFNEAAIYSQGTDGVNRILFMAYIGELVMYSASGGSTVVNVRANWSPSLNTWYHVAYSKSSGTSKLFVDGTSLTLTAATEGTFPDLAAQAVFGREDYNAARYINGQIDELRISKGTAYWTSNFTPPRRSEEAANDKLLLHFDEGADNLCSGGTNDACDASSAAHDMAINGNPTWVTDARAVMDNNSRYVSLGSSSAVNTDRGMELKITSTTAFQYRWSGDQTWITPATSTLSSYTFASPAQIDSTGVYVGFDTTNGTFGDESYFLIPSWALEQFSDSDTQNAMRGTKRGFPERSYLVATDKGVDILDADTNNLWMRVENGSGRSLGTFTNNTPSSVFMSHGQLFVGTNGTAATGLYRYDFNRDKIYRYNATNRTTNTVNIAKRNTADSSYGSADTTQNLISSVVNDVHALTMQGKLMLATANSTGLTKIANIMSTDTSYDYSDNASDAYGHVVLAENASGAGDVYADNDTTDALERWNNVLDDAASETAGTPDTTYDETSTPAIFVTAATEINDLKLTNQTSTVEAASPTIYLAHDLGATVLNEKRSDPTNGSVKYENISRVTEEMIGDTNGMWSLDDANDSSVKANNLTNNAGVTFTTSGVRGKAAHFTAASSQYLSKADNASLSTGNINWTIAGWVYLDTKLTSNYYMLFNKGQGTAYEYQIFYDGPTYDRFAFSLYGGGDSSVANVVANNPGSPATGMWHFIVIWNDVTNNQVGIQVNNGTPNTSTGGIGADTTSGFSMGASFTGSMLLDGRIDEVLFTKEVLTAAQRTQLYVSGKEALNNKYRVKLASDTLNQLNGSTNTTKAVAATKLNQTGVTRGEYLYVGTNGSAADDGSLSRILVNGDTRDREYDESTKEPYLLTDNDISSLSISSDGAYIVVGTDDQGITIIQNGSNAVRLRGGSKTQGPYKRPHN